MLAQTIVPVRVELDPAQHLPAAHDPKHLGQLRHKFSHPLVPLIELPFRPLGLGQCFVCIKEQYCLAASGRKGVLEIRGPKHRQPLGNLRGLKLWQVAQLS